MAGRKDKARTERAVGRGFLKRRRPLNNSKLRLVRANGRAGAEDDSVGEEERAPTLLDIWE